MKMHNFTIRGNCLEIVGRIVHRGSKEPVKVYDIDFPDGMENLSMNELRDVCNRLKEDIDDLFCSWGQIRDNTIQTFEEIWNDKPEEGEEDAHGA